MRYLVHKNIPIVTALDTILGVWGNIGGYAFFSNALLAAAEGRRACEV